MESQGGFSAFIPLIIMMIPLIFICRQLAKNKGKNIFKYTILGFIPLVNYFTLIYLVGTPDEKLEEKLNRILSIIEHNKSSASN